jgi:hypothetical protein
MDSSAYKTFLAEFGSSERSSWKQIPVHFSLCAPSLCPEAFLALKLFLSDIAGYSDTPCPFKLPRCLGDPRIGIDGKLLSAMHAKILEFIEAGVESEESRRSGMELYRQIVSLNENAITDSLDMAMAVFMLEALMHAGWCSSRTENSGKQAAHALFDRLRKSLFRVEQQALPTIYCYLWGAWLLAQKTEGIRDKKLPARD